MPAVSRPIASTNDLDAIFDALAHPTRRAILLRLKDGPASVGELVEPFRVSQQAISRHVAVLHRAGLITQRKQGRESWCSLRTRPLQEADMWIGFYRSLWDERLQKLTGYLAAAKAGERGR